jgi:hypothetical protein
VVPSTVIPIKKGASMKSSISRLAGWFAACAISIVVAALLGAEPVPETPPITPPVIQSAEKIIGLEFTPTERDSMIDDLTENLNN